MASRRIAIINLRKPVNAGLHTSIELILWAISGVDYVRMGPSGTMIHLIFNDQQLGLAELVRVIEDAGASVTSVTQRPAGTRLAV